MNTEFLDILRCPRTHQKLELTTVPDSSTKSWLKSSDGAHLYPIENDIPRFVPASNYADNFGLQWNRFSKTQLDSFSGIPISAERFWGATGWDPESLKGQWVLDAGCGSGRFAEIALAAGAKVVALDYSSAVDACLDNLKHEKNLYVVQGDIYALPFKEGAFKYVYSIGVLQHTPDVARAFSALPSMASEDGEVCADFYWKRLRTMLHTKYLLRPLTKRMPTERLFAILERIVPTLLKLSQLLGAVPALGVGLQRMIPVVDYTGIYELSDEQLVQWALLDTFDMLAPEYDNPQTLATVQSWFESSGLHGIEVFKHGHLVGRGRKHHF